LPNVGKKAIRQVGIKRIGENANQGRSEMKHDRLIERLMETENKWKWANREVSDVARESVDAILYLQQRVIDLEGMLVRREMYKGEG
jgi:hypothetical protein